MTPEEEFLADRIADPMLRSRDIIEAIGLAVAAEARGASGALAAVLEDARRPIVIRRLAAAAFCRLAGAAAGRARFGGRPRGTVDDDRTVWALAAGDSKSVVEGLDSAATDDEVSGWLAVAHTLGLRDSFPALIRVLRNPARHFDVRRQAAEIFRALTAGDESARTALRTEAPQDGSTLDELLAIAVGDAPGLP